MRAAAIIVLTSGLIAGAPQAHAAGPSTDLRCMVTMAALSNNKANQPQASLGIFYFAGRIKAQQPNFDFATELRPAAAKMKPEDYQAELKRCGPMVMNVIRDLKAAQGSGAPQPETPAKK